MDTLLVLLTIQFIVLVLLDIAVTRRLYKAWRGQVTIDVLNGALVVAAGITIGCGIGVLLGINGVFIRLGWPRFLPMEITLLLLDAAVAVPSLCLAYLFRVLRKLRVSQLNGGK